MCDRSSSEKVLCSSNKQSNPTEKKCCSDKSMKSRFNLTKSMAYEMDEHCKRKRLKTRKERSQTRGDWKDPCKVKSYHSHHCHCQFRKEMSHFQTSYPCSSKKKALISSVVNVPQEPSIITSSRLIGHHGLFNHEVKSIDIERLLSEQKKCENKETGKEKCNETPQLPFSSPIPNPTSGNRLPIADAIDEQFRKKAEPPAKNYVCHDGEEQGSYITPQQQQDPNLSSEGCKSILSSKHSSHRMEITTTKNTNYVGSEGESQLQLTPLIEKDDTKISAINIRRRVTFSDNRRRQKKADETLSDVFDPVRLQLSSSSTSDSFDIQPESLAINAVATRLCESLPHFKRRNLVSETREKLLMSLHEKHGLMLDRNLEEVQKCLRFGFQPLVDFKDQVPVEAEDDVSLFTDLPHRMMRSSHLDWTFTEPQIQQQTTEWDVNPVDEVFRPDASPLFCMNFEQNGSTPHEFFVRPPTECKREKYLFDPWEKSLNKSNKDSEIFDPFENPFNDSSAEFEKSNTGLEHHYNKFQPAYSFQAKQQRGYATHAMQLSKEPEIFETDPFSLAPSFPSRSHLLPESNHFRPFNQYNQSLSFSSFRAHHIDMALYPPSHMLEKSPGPPASSLPSPQQWSFPPMKLY